MLKEILEKVITEVKVNESLQIKLPTNDISEIELNAITPTDLEAAFENCFDEMYEKNKKLQDPKYGVPNIKVDLISVQNGYLVVNVTIKEIFNYDGDDRPVTHKELKFIIDHINKHADISDVEDGLPEIGCDKPLFVYF